jgi:hypothetical protein
MKLILILIFALQSAVASAVAVTIHGAGLYSCGEWTVATPNNRGQFIPWLQGYLSGLSAALQRDVLQGTDRDAVVAWMDNYCRAHPLDKVADGAMRLFIELDKRK